MNVHKTFRRRPERLLNVLCTFNLRPVSTGNCSKEILTVKKQVLRKCNCSEKICYIWEKRHHHLKKKQITFYFQTVSISASYFQTFFLRACFAKSALNSTDLFQGSSQGFQFEWSYLGSLVIGSSLGSSVTRFFLGSWVLKCLKMYFLKFDVFS